MKRFLVVVALAVAIGGVLAQEGTAFAQPATDQPAPVIPPPLSEAQKNLNKAIDRKMNAGRMSDLQDVVALCEKAIEEGLDPADEEFASQLIVATLYEQSERLIQSLVDAKLDLAWARRRQLALQSIQKAIKTDPDDPDALLMLAELHALPGGDREAGLDAATKAVALLDGKPLRRSEALLMQSGFRESNEEKLEDFNQALAANPANLDALRQRGKVHLMLNQADKALADFKTLLKKDQTDAESVEIVAQLLAGQEKYDEAIELINSAIDADGDEASGYVLRANIELARGKLDAALDDLKTALQHDPRDLRALLTRAQVYHAKEDYEQAIADTTRVLELRPGMIQALILRSQYALAAENFKQALADLRSLLRLNPKAVPLRLQMAAVYLADNRPGMAIDLYDQIIEEDKDVSEAYHGRGDAWLGMGEHQKAVKDYEIAFEGLPEDTGLLNNYAWVLATSTIDEVRDGKKAVELAKKACELTNYEKPHIISTLAAAFAEIGDFEKAVEWSSKAVDLGDGEINEQLAEELSNYRLEKPWRERQSIDDADEDGLANDLDTDDDTGDDADQAP